MKFAVIASALLLTSAVRADASNFDGPRVEARVGLDHSRLSGTFDDGDAINGEKQSDNSLSYGFEAGYDAQLADNFLLGAYAGIDFSTAKSCTEIFGDDEACLKNGRNFTAGIRAGTNLTENLLVYAKGGYSNGRLSVSYDDGAGGFAPFTVVDNRDGFHLGAGGEFAISAGTFAKLEYVYTDYSNANFADEDVSVGVDRARHQIVLGFGLRF